MLLLTYSPNNYYVEHKNNGVHDVHCVEVCTEVCAPLTEQNSQPPTVCYHAVAHYWNVQASEFFQNK